MSVAVLGGGITGVCVALALAERGVLVDLYEQSPQLISQASCFNEGKLHLGFVYAGDRSRKTARTMIEGALRFRPVLSRWIEDRHFEEAVSDPFIYAVHRDTMVAGGAIEEHFTAVSEIYAAFSQKQGVSYVGPGEAPLWQRQSLRETNAVFDTNLVAASYQTMERSIDAFLIARELRRAVSVAPGITAVTEATVKAVKPIAKGQLRVTCERHGAKTAEDYESVVNALWQNRLKIDQTAGLAQDRPVMHRFKVGLFSRPSTPSFSLPTVTFMLGSFGDTVRFRDRAYVSWYPAGHLHTSNERAPRSSADEILQANSGTVELSSLKALSQLIASAHDGLLASAGEWDVGGGYITAWARTGLEDIRSQLHQRFDVGVHSTGAYHSVDTGKYTLGPQFAMIAADRIRPAPGTARPADRLAAPRTS